MSDNVKDYFQFAKCPVCGKKLCREKLPSGDNPPWNCAICNTGFVVPGESPEKATITQIPEKQAEEMLSSENIGTAYLGSIENNKILSRWKEKGYIRQSEIENETQEPDDLDYWFEVYIEKINNFANDRVPLIQLIKLFYKEIKELKG